MKHIWKDVIGYEGLYQVSNFGFVKSLPRPRSDGRGKWKGQPLIPLEDTAKYLFVYLWKDGHSKAFRVHRLVLLAFVGPCPKGNYCNHKNGTRWDNRIDNLEWVTPSENNTHSYRVLGRAPVICKGEENGFSKLTKKDVDEIRRLRKVDPKHWTFERIGNKFGIVKSHTKRIVDRESWR